MRDRMERLVVLPFTVGCVSHSSVAVIERTPRRSKSDRYSSSIGTLEEEEENDDKESLSSVNMRRASFRFVALPKPNISTGFHRLFRTFKSFSHFFVYKEEMEMETEMEIGFPTDVKHVTHIGSDGSATTNPIRGWNNLIAPELLSLPSVNSLRQFEVAMATQADSPHVNVSS